MRKHRRISLAPWLSLIASAAIKGTPEILACDSPIACNVEDLRVGIAWSGSVVVQ